MAPKSLLKRIGNIQHRNLLRKFVFKEKFDHEPKAFVHKIIFIDSAPTSKGKCIECRKIITKNTPRGWYMDYMYLKDLKEGKRPKNWIGDEIRIKRLICYNCVIPRIEKVRNKLKELREHYTSSLKKFKRSMSGKKAKFLIQSGKALEELERDEGSNPFTQSYY